MMKLPGQLVFGLDIGTRSIVGTVGYRIGERFHVVAQCIKEHETRAMLDGQIHDIHKVGNTINEVKNTLETQIGRPLKDVCIAAAGRVLRTVTTSVEYEFGSEKEVTGEDIYALDSMGVEKAYQEFLETNDTEIKFYCVGYSVVRYYMNHYPMGNLEGHKAKVIGADIIATFLPDDVVDGLHKAVEIAGLEVANLTLEPIAAIQVAIPEMYRMLNIALVDVGAGTSDISITKDGSIVAYGMIPVAGDSLTEVIARHCLVDFGTAENIKREAGVKETVEYKDIMGLSQTISSEEISNVVEPIIKDMTKQVADKIKELNGDKSVSAVFVVGGGGKMPGYTDALAEELGIQKERVAVRGEEVMQKIEFLQEDAKKDSLMVTPIGICLTFYEQSNNFIFVYFNEQRIKLYDNNKLAVVDAAMQAEFSNEGLFPKRGKELNYLVNGKQRITRGALGESAVITVNGQEADIYTAVHANDNIKVVESTAGAPATMDINQLPEYGATMSVEVNEKKVELPQFAMVNGQLQSGYYSIQENDNIEFLNYYTVRQIAEFMDVIIKEDMNIYVNNKLADMNTKVYENFSVVWTMEELQLSDRAIYGDGTPDTFENLPEDDGAEERNLDTEGTQSEENAIMKENALTEEDEVTEENATEEKTEAASGIPLTIQVTVNGSPIRLEGKTEYVYVDVFQYIDFDLSKPQGSGIVTNLNGRPAQYMEPIRSGDVIQIYWKD
ncbi:MAG: cell division protein FtsA [Lachnospiraceae bacterium]|nr:cell division protein FtsA [Lachnospiraceae bacterium]